MAVTVLTKVFQTSDKQIFSSQEEAERHEQIQELVKDCKRASDEAMHDIYGPTRDYRRFYFRCAEELYEMGYRKVGK